MKFRPHHLGAGHAPVCGRAEVSNASLTHHFHLWTEVHQTLELFKRGRFDPQSKIYFHLFQSVVRCAEGLQLYTRATLTNLGLNIDLCGFCPRIVLFTGAKIYIIIKGVLGSANLLPKGHYPFLRVRGI